MNQPQQFYDGYGDLLEVSVDQGDVCLESFLNPDDGEGTSVSLFFHPTPAGRGALRKLGELLVELSQEPPLKTDDKTEGN